LSRVWALSDGWQISTHDMRQLHPPAVHRKRRLAPAIVSSCSRILAISFFLLGLAQRARAATMSSLLSDAQTEVEEDKLSEEVNDPTAMLTQVRLFDFYTPENFRSQAQTNVALIQPIIPVARLSLLPIEQIIRPTIKLSTTATGPGSQTVTGLSDIQLYDLFQSQWPHLERWKLRWAIGTTAVFPTATDRRNGAGAWQLGPAAALSFAGVPNLWVGVLAQNPISFAYTRKDATPQDAMLFQPGFSYRLWRGWYVKSTDSIWTINWRHKTPTTIPVSFGVGKISQLDGQMIDTWVSGERMAYEQSTTVTPMWTVRFGLNFIFPEFVLGQ
jgi:hypothetical protein